MSETGRVMKRRNPYMVVDVTPFRDTRLSWKAKGLMTYFLDKPEGWNFILEHLFKQAPDGERSVRSGLKELQKFGYLVRAAHRIGNKVDSWEWLIYEEPVKYPTDKPIHVNSKKWKDNLENGGTIDITLFVQNIKVEKNVDKPLLVRNVHVQNEDVQNVHVQNAGLVINKGTSAQRLKYAII